MLMIVTMIALRFEIKLVLVNLLVHQKQVFSLKFIYRRLNLLNLRRIRLLLFKIPLILKKCHFILSYFWVNLKNFPNAPMRQQLIAFLLQANGKFVVISRSLIEQSCILKNAFDILLETLGIEYVSKSTRVKTYTVHWVEFNQVFGLVLNELIFDHAETYRVFDYR